MAVCAECGFLGRHRKGPGSGIDRDADLVEITKIERDAESLVRVRAPACFKGLVSFPPKDDTKVAALSVERDCVSYSKHRAGLLPRGLQEFLMLEEIREREDRRNKAQRDWQLERDRLQLDWQRDETNIQRNFEKTIDRGNRRDRWILGVLTLLAIAASAVVSSLAAVGVIGG